MIILIMDIHPSSQRHIIFLEEKLIKLLINDWNPRLKGVDSSPNAAS